LLIFFKKAKKRVFSPTHRNVLLNLELEEREEEVFSPLYLAVGQVSSLARGMWRQVRKWDN